MPFGAGFIGLTVWMHGEPKKERLERVAQSGSKWHPFAWLLCHFARPSGDPGRDLPRMGQAKVATSQTTTAPSFVSANSTCLQPTSGPGSTVSDWQSGRGTSASTAPLPGEGRFDRLGSDVARKVSAHPLHKQIVHQFFHSGLGLGGKSGVSRWLLLGRKIRRILKLCGFARREMLAVRGRRPP
jgi:hypothetical protein